MFNLSKKMLQLPQQQLFLDSRGKGTTFISHAHADHAVKSAVKLICSNETLALLKCRRYVKENVELINTVDGAKITLLDAGHVLGSRQILVENGSKFLYTGDLHTSPSLTAGKAEVEQCDELLIECTYGSPQYVFPYRMEVGEQVAKWTLANERKGIISVIGGYSLGKAQEIIAHLNAFGVTPVVPAVIAEVSNCYNSFGAKLDFLSLKSLEGQEALRSSGFTAVFPLSSVSLELASALRQGYGREVRLAHCSGWTLAYRKPGITGFPLSDHAGFNELIQFVQGAGAKKVYCVYGYSVEFAHFLKRKGIDAVALKESASASVGQTTLQGFMAKAYKN